MPRKRRLGVSTKKMEKPVYRVVSLNVGLPRAVPHESSEVLTGIFKHPVDGPVRLTTTGFEGDGQADPVHHGGPDKAVNAYSFSHYPHWSRVLGKDLKAPSFGENLTLDGATEDLVWIGDTFELGTSVVQVTGPRGPCYKLGIVHSDPGMAARVEESRFTGFYLRVLREGVVRPEDALRQIDRLERGLPVRRVYEAVVDRSGKDREAIVRAASTEGLGARWRKELEGRIASWI